MASALAGESEHEGKTELRVNTLAGFVCTVHASLDWTVAEAKAAIEEALPRIPVCRQRLLVGEVELLDSELLSSVFEVGKIAEVTLVQRTPEQADWIQKAGSEFTQLLENKDAWSDHDTVLAAVHRSGASLQYASDELRGDREVVLAAVAESGLALQHASPALVADPGVVLHAVERCGRALEFASPELLEQDDFVTAAVRSNWRCLEYCSDAHRANRALVMEAVAKSGRALGSASPELKDDFEVVALAVQQDPTAIAFASAILRTDPELKALARAGTVRRRNSTKDNPAKHGYFHDNPDASRWMQRRTTV